MAAHNIEKTIVFENMNRSVVATDLIGMLKNAIQEGCKEINLDFSPVKSVFSNAAVPVCGIIDYYRKHFGLTFKRIDKNHRVDITHIVQPLTTHEHSEILSKQPLNHVWQFDSSADVNIVVDSLVNELRKIEQFETGVLDGLTWSLNEIMDNVLQHSGVSYGFVMGQIHRNKKHIAFCVYDTGQGIYNSLKNSSFAPKTPQEGLELAIRERVTRDKSIGQGNGMYGLNQIVKFNDGSLTIISNTALYKIEKNRVKFLNNVPTISEDNGGTFIDLQLDYNNKVSIADALNIGGKPHTNYVNYYLENLENDEGELVYYLKTWIHGTGTRPSGKMLRNEIINNYRETQRRVVVDFSEIKVISSSFADELIGKLVIEFGFFGFNTIVRLKHMNALIQQIVQRSVAQRMGESVNHNG
jgi:hypothetical protein